VREAKDVPGPRTSGHPNAEFLRTLTGGPRRVNAPQEERLRHVDGPEPGQVPLVEERLADGPAGLAG